MSNKDFMLSFDFGMEMSVNGTVTKMTCGAIRRAGNNNLFAVTTPYSLYMFVDGEYIPYSYDDFIFGLTDEKYYQLRMVKGTSRTRDTIDPELIQLAEETGKKIADFQICFNIKESMILVDGKPVDLEALELGEIEELFSADTRPFEGMRVYFDDITLPEKGHEYAGRTIYQMSLSGIHIELGERSARTPIGANRMRDILSKCRTTKFDVTNVKAVNVAVMQNLYGNARPTLTAPTFSRMGGRTAADILAARRGQVDASENATGGVKI